MGSPRAILLVALVLLTGCAEVPSQPEVPQPQGGSQPIGSDQPDEPQDPATTAGNLTVEVLDVGQGDAIHVHGPNGTMLVDAGNWHQASRQAVVDHLARDGVDVLDAFVITHPDADHAGACRDVLDRFSVQLVLHPGSSKDTQTWSECQAAIDAEATVELTDADVDPGHVLEANPSLTPTVLWIDRDVEDPNDGSVVLRLSYGGTDALLTGDAPCKVEETILATGQTVEADLLKVGHHGSSTSTCSAFLDAVDPRLAALSVGENNGYGHPHREVLDRLAAHDAALFRTDEDGTLTFTTDGSAWETTSTASPPAPASQAAVTISAVHADAPGNDNENLTGEWVNLTSTGNESVEISGFELSDEAGHVYRFPQGTRLASNATLTVYTGQGDDTATELYWGRGQAVWNNGGDTARLVDTEGRLVDEHTYP